MVLKTFSHGHKLRMETIPIILAEKGGFGGNNAGKTLPVNRASGGFTLRSFLKKSSPVNKK